MDTSYNNVSLHLGFQGLISVCHCDRYLLYISELFNRHKNVKKKYYFQCVLITNSYFVFLSLNSIQSWNLQVCLEFKGLPASEKLCMVFSHIKNSPFLIQSKSVLQQETICKTRQTITEALRCTWAFRLVFLMFFLFIIKKQQHKQMLYSIIISCKSTGIHNLLKM